MGLHGHTLGDYTKDGIATLGGIGDFEIQMKSASPAKLRPTIKEVAKLAGVSFKTVARVVNAEPNVSTETRDAVTRAMTMLGYTTNISARQLSSSRSFLIGFLYETPHHYVFVAQSGAIARCREAGYHLLSEEVPPGCEREIASRLNNLGVDGVIVTPPLSYHEPLLAALREQGLRHVLISPDDTPVAVPVVFMDDESAAQEMTKFLIELGHQNIAFISGGARLASKRRHAGFVAALKQAGIPRQMHLESEGDFTFLSGEKLAQDLLQASKRPTAIFAANDIMALGVLVAAARLGISVPDDLSVAGFDDMPASIQVHPELTTVRQPFSTMAASAVDILLDREGYDEHRRNVFDFEIIRRESTCPPRQTDVTMASAR